MFPFSSYAGSTKLSLFATPVEEPRTKKYTFVIAGGKSSLPLEPEPMLTDTP